MKATLIGLAICAVGTFVGGLTKGVNPVYLFSNVPAILIVIIGGLGATMASFDMKASTNAIKAMMRAILPKAATPPAENLTILVDFANRARREGLLSLESEVGNIEDPFMKRSIQLAIDGNDPEDVAGVMRTDIKSMKARHKTSADWCQAYGIFAPTFGIIGAVMGLISTLSYLDQPDKLGAGIAAAFVATFWGVFMANGIMLPLANRLKAMSADEVVGREMVMEGVLAIQSGQSPRVIEETLLTYLAPAEAETVRSDAA